MRLAHFLLPILASTAIVSNAQPAPPPPPVQFDTRPIEHNDDTLRPLSPEEIPPNLNFYAINPLYRPGTPLGWAEQRIEEKLSRGLVATVAESGRVVLSWRLLTSDPRDIAFNVYRAASEADTAPTKLNRAPVAHTTDFIDTTASFETANSWFVRAVVDGRELEPSPVATLPASPPVQNYRAIKLRDDVRGVAITAVGDLDGDGTYDFVVKHPAGGKDPGRIVRSPGTYKIDAYNGKTGEFMWRIDLGWNVDMGIWWTPMVVRDLDGDNKAEVCLRTKPYAATLEEALPGAMTGNVLDGPEWLSVFDGETGKEIAKADWIELGKVQDWGDNTGNRASRHMLGIAYLDGKTPAVLVVRGTYGMMKVDAWTLKNKRLEKIWRWTNERAPFLFHGQGQHSIKVGDIDGDGCDEILNGSLAIDNDGRTMWSSGLGHGDRFYLTDVNPSRPGLEIAYVIEEAQPQLGLHLRDARNGDLIWGARESNRDNAIDQCAVGDIDPKYPGMEVWANKGLEQRFYSAQGEPIPGPVPPTSELVWWDADLLREQVFTPRDSSSAGTLPASASSPATATPSAAASPERTTRTPLTRSIGKWRDGAHEPLTADIQGSIQHVADLEGDWREEIVTYTNGELRVYRTTIPATDRRVSLMQDPIYRHDVTHRSMGYAHVPQVSYYLGEK